MNNKQNLQLIHNADTSEIIFVDVNKPDVIIDKYNLTDVENDLYKHNLMTDEKASKELVAFLKSHSEEIINNRKENIIVLKEVTLQSGQVDIRQLDTANFNQIQFNLLENLNAVAVTQNVLIQRNNDLLEAILSLFGKDVAKSKELLTKEIESRKLKIENLSNTDKKQLFFDVETKILECSIVNVNNTKLTNLILSIIAEEIGIDLKTAFNKNAGTS